MQRLILRLSAVGAVLGVGVLAIVQAHFRTNKSDAVAGEPPAVAETRSADEVPQPIPFASDEDTAPLTVPTAQSFRQRVSPPARDVIGLAPDQPASEPAARFVDSQPPISRPPTSQPATSQPAEHTYGEPGTVRTVAGESPAEDQYAGTNKDQYAAGTSDQYAADQYAAGTSDPYAAGQYAAGTSVPGGDAAPTQPPGSGYGYADGSPEPAAPASDPPQDVTAGYDPGPYAQPPAAPGGYGQAPAEPPGDAPPTASQPEGTPAYAAQPLAQQSPVDTPEQPPVDTPDQSPVGIAEQPPAGIAEQPPAGLTQYEQPATGSPTDQVAIPPDSQPSEGGSVYGQVGDYGSATANSSVATGDAMAAGNEGQGQPGDRRLEGLQSPSLAIEKVAPDEIQVNRPARFSIRVRNVGQSAAHQVIVTDEVPAGTRFVRSTPDAALGSGGSLTWQLGSLPPGQEATIVMELLPLREGEIGSVAQVSFQAEASVRTICTQPKLKLTQTTEPKVLAGERLAIRITLSNEGSGAASGVVIEEDVPEGLLHSAGRELEYEVGTLRPGETKDLELTLTADKPGPVRNRLAVRADGEILVEDTVELTVVAPQLKVAVDGPRKRYLERQATYTIALANNGTAPARDVELSAQLPPSFKFVETNHHGRYDPQSHAVLWSLAELPPGVEGSVELKVLPSQMGGHTLRIEGRGAGNLSDQAELPVTVEGLAALFFQVGDAADPIPVGTETTYEVRVTNTGSKAATNVRIVANLPAGMLPLSGQGPTRVLVEGQQMTSEPITRLEPRADAVYKFLVRGVEQGDQRVRIQLISDELEAPVLKEESTLVYSDR